MKTFHVDYTWTDSIGTHERQKQHGCREIFIAGMTASALYRHHYYGDPLPTNLTISLIASDLNPSFIQEILQPTALECHPYTRQEAFTTRTGYTLKGDDANVLAGMYWLILVERLQHISGGTFLEVLNKTERNDWDRAYDRRWSVYAWELHTQGKIPNTFELLRYRQGVIDYLRSNKWRI